MPPGRSARPNSRASARRRSVPSDVTQLSHGDHARDVRQAATLQPAGAPVERPPDTIPTGRRKEEDRAHHQTLDQTTRLLPGHATQPGKPRAPSANADQAAASTRHGEDPNHVQRPTRRTSETQARPEEDNLSNKAKAVSQRATTPQGSPLCPLRISEPRHERGGRPTRASRQQRRPKLTTPKPAQQRHIQPFRPDRARPRPHPSTGIPGPIPERHGATSPGPERHGATPPGQADMRRPAHAPPRRPSLPPTCRVTYPSLRGKSGSTPPQVAKNPCARAKLCERGSLGYGSLMAE
jgi:hypothetical protein